MNFSLFIFNGKKFMNFSLPTLKSIQVRDKKRDYTDIDFINSSQHTVASILVNVD